MGQLLDAIEDPFIDAFHQGITAANIETRRFVAGRLPKQDGELESGLRVLKIKGRPTDDVIKTNFFFTDRNTTTAGRTRATAPSNQYVANSLSKAGKLGVTRSEVEAFWRANVLREVSQRLGAL